MISGLRRASEIRGLALSIASKSVLIYALLMTPFITQLAIIQNRVPDFLGPLLNSAPSLEQGMGALGLSVSGFLFLLARPVDGRVTSKALQKWNVRVAVDRGLEPRQVRTLRKLSEIEIQILHSYTLVVIAVAFAGLLVPPITWLFLALVILWTIPIGALRAKQARHYLESFSGPPDPQVHRPRKPDPRQLLDWLTAKQSSSIRELVTVAPLVGGALILPVVLGRTSEPIGMLFTIALTGIITAISIQLGPAISRHTYLLSLYLRDERRI